MSDEPYQIDIRDILSAVQAGHGASRGLRDKMIEILRHFRNKGIPLSVCADSKHLNRSLSTLQGYCREGSIAFPDYTPYDMRSEEERKRGPKKPKADGQN